MRPHSRRIGTRERTAEEKVILEFVTVEKEYVKSLSMLQQLFIIPLRENGEKGLIKGVSVHLPPKSPRSSPLKPQSPLQASSSADSNNSGPETRIDDYPAAPVLPEEFIPAMFGSVEQILLIHEMLVADLENLQVDQLEAQDAREILCSLFIEKAQTFRLYTSYLGQYKRHLDFIRETCSLNPELKEFIAGRERYLRDTGFRTHALNSFMIMPVQRLPRYVLLLRELQKQAGDSGARNQKLAQSIQIIEQVSSLVNEKTREKECTDKVKELQLQYNLKNFITPSRKLIREDSTLRLIKGGKYNPNANLEELLRPCTVYLLSDFLLIVKHNKHRLSTSKYKLFELPLVSGSVSLYDVAECIFSVGTAVASGDSSNRSVMIQTKSPEEKQEWMQAIQEICRPKNR